MLKANHSYSSYPHHQSGAALLLVLVFILLVAASFLLDRISSRAQINASAEQRSTAALAEAKTALIAWAVRHPSEPGTLPWPDRNGEGTPNYDGSSDCVTTGFINSHLLGRLPFAGEITCGSFVAFGGFARDGAGEPLWYAVSRNLLWNRGQAAPDPAINPGLLDALPTYNWLSVCNQAGNLISNRVAAVIIAPGAALSGQDRSGVAPNANQYLDSVSIGGNTYNNFDSDGLPDAAPCGAPGEDFIIYPDSRLTPVVNDSFNDRLIYITIDELMSKVERRVLGDAAVGLKNYYDDYLRYPWLSPYRDPTATTGPLFNGVWGQREGHIPFIAAGETYGIATGWTVTWSNGTSAVPTCTPGGFPAGLTIDATPITGCDSLLNSYQTGAWAKALPVLPVTLPSNGNCLWTNIDTVNCLDNTEVRINAYTVDLTCGPPECVAITPLPATPVTRTYVYTLNYTGSGQISPAVVGNIKTRQVTNSLLPTTIQMQDTVNVNGNPYILWSDTVTVPVNDYTVDGIYFDIEDGVEFPGYFFTNLWHRYIYVKISDEHVAINDAGGASSDNCTAGTDCVSLQIGATPVRNDIQAIVVGAGGQLTGQNRSNGNLTDYFENTNAATANDLAERSTLTATFNDQARVVAPLPP